ncbi:MAG: aminomethyl-transferring glycine dehydrogenase subunit GcvPA [Thermoplasmata archaeon]
MSSLVRWIPDGPDAEREMLEAIGLHSPDELFADVPKKARIGRMGIGGGLSEAEALRAIDKILDRNRPYSKFANFLGGRTSTRYSPAAVDAILQRSEFYTAYTPYQPEASQGMLQALFEFQSIWVELTGLDIANASLYDGATASGEALLLCRRIHEGRRFLVPASLPWEEKSVLENYGVGQGLTIQEIPVEERTGTIDLTRLSEELARGDVFGMLADLPNGFGHLDGRLFELRSILGSVPLVVRADPLALTVLEPPASYGADVVVGEGQSFGIPPSYGGPLLGLFACKKEHARFAPGRIVGATHDRNGRRAFTLTLQTREQHIRRSRATSNICTNQSLIALAFVVYASVVGPRGLAELQRSLAEKARTVASGLASVEGLRSPRFDAPYLSDFTVELAHGTSQEFLDRLRRKGVLGGYSLADPRPTAPAGPERIVVSATETTDDKSIAKYVQAARSVMAAMGGRR